MAIIQLTLEYKMKKDIINKLKLLGFVDGVNLQNNTILNTDTTFWQNVLNHTKSSQNNSYIIYQISPDKEDMFGDGESVIAELNCSVDLYTINSPESEATFNLRKLIEEEFSKQNWKIEYNLYEYDKDTRLNHFSYTVSSIYGSDD